MIIRLRIRNNLAILVYVTLIVAKNLSYNSSNNNFKELKRFFSPLWFIFHILKISLFLSSYELKNRRKVSQLLFSTLFLEEEDANNDN